MRLVSYIGADDITTGFLVGDRVIPLIEGVITSFDLEPERLDDLRERAAALRGAVGLALEDVDLMPPILDPGKIVCVGLNYSEHAKEGGRDAPERPLLFSKFANAVIGDGDPIVRPEGTHALDLEVELAVVIGSTARRVSREAALEHVAGYLVVNDVSARDWQGQPQALREGEVGDGQWLRAKGSDTFFPIGPVFVTADEIPDPQTLRLRSWLTKGSGPDAGREMAMQDGTTADMIFEVAALIEHITKVITLQPGDIISTGTPAGVGVFRDPPVYLEPGDRVRCEVEGIGMVENPVIDWTDDLDDFDDLDDEDDLDDLAD
jgi:2,4-diketo-3-deoxy-L-fuconate hydrolase